MNLAIIRFVDVAAALLIGLAAIPFLTVAAVMVRMDSPGPALFRQARVGRHEKTFTCLKLRTMHTGTPSAGSHEVSSTRVTALGRHLRRLKIDELPQLWNVLVGEMSLVGPRPCLLSQDLVIDARRPLKVFDVRPGVTGPAQIKAIDMSTPTKLAEEDAHWSRSQKFSDYLQILLLTIGGRGRGDRVNDAI